MASFKLHGRRFFIGPTQRRAPPEARRILERTAGTEGGMRYLRSVFAAERHSADKGALDDEAILSALAALVARGELVLVQVRPELPQAVPLRGAAPEPEPEPEPEPQDTHYVAFEITDQLGEMVSGIDYVLSLPDGSTEEGSLAGKQIKRTRIKRGTYELTLKVVTGPEWGGGAARTDTAIKLRARVSGFDPGAQGRFEIHDAGALDQAPVATLQAVVASGGVLEAEWTPALDELEEVKSGDILFFAMVGKAHAVSPPIPAQIKHTIDMRGPRGPLPDTPVVARFSGGTTASVTSIDGKAEVWANVGESLRWIELPEHADARITIEEGSE